MTYIENIFICLVAPMVLSLFFTIGRARKFMVFVILGKLTCVLSAYVSGFFMALSGADAVATAIEIAPVCEEILKILPVVLYYLIFEPNLQELPTVTVAIAVGFATLENACYLAQNGAENFMILLIRGLAAGALHLLCGVVAGFGMKEVFRWKWLATTGTIGLIGVCAGLHGIYNLLISSSDFWHWIGYLFPSMLVMVLMLLRFLWPKLKLQVR